MTSNSPSPIVAALAPEIVARRAGLTYVTSEAHGITRRRCGKGFAYHNGAGKVSLDEGMRNRIDSLVIPPAWSNVWICPDPRGHIQATGRDGEGRKQYLYHPAWREAQDRLKFDRMLPFGRALPGLRRTVRRDLKREGIPFAKVAGAAVRTLDIAAIRVGNDRYAVSNGSFGLTTLRTKHIQHDGPSVVFEFEAKGGKQTRVTIGDQGLVRVLRELDGVPGYRVFQYADPSGVKRDLTSDDVNQYLSEAAGNEFSAKDFRTWAGNARAVDLLFRARYPTSPDVRNQRIRETLQDVADHLGNTPAVARSSYVDPRLLELYEGGGFSEFKRQAKGRVPELARPDRRKRECLLIALLEAL